LISPVFDGLFNQFIKEVLACLTLWKLT
jgi:hypothetical protein